MQTVLVVLAFLAVAGCTPVPAGKVAKTAKAVGTAIQDGRDVRLSDHTDFAWDTLYVFSPYSTQEAVCGARAITWHDCKSIAPEVVPESEFLLIFGRDGRYAAHERHSRASGDYCESTCTLVVPIGDAVFRGQPQSVGSAGNVQYLLRRAAA